MNFRDIIICILCIFVLYIIINNNKYEHLTSLSNEAIQSLASAYNTGNMAVTNLNVTGSFNLLPRGVIVAWYYSTVPNGWALCDGTNGTPDLRSRFVIGSGQGIGLTNRPIGSYGGEESHVLSLNEIPSHTHTMPGDDMLESWATRLSNISYDADSRYSGNGGIFATSSSGGSQAHNNMPPYYALAYIMKL